MKRMLRLGPLGVLLLLLLSSACRLPWQSPSISPATPTRTPIDIILNTGTPAAEIPVTGQEAVVLQCQFCVAAEAHVVLIMSADASFEVSEPNADVNCSTASELHGRRILLCGGLQQTSFTFDVCVSGADCQQYRIKLQRCAFVSATETPTFRPIVPILITPRNTRIPFTPVPTNTEIITPLPTSTTIPPTAPTSTPQPPTTEPPTTEPPTSEPTTEPPTIQPASVEPTAKA